MKIHPLGAELFHADGQTDMTNLIVVFRKFANTPKTFSRNHLIIALLGPNKKDL